MSTPHGPDDAYESLSSDLVAAISSWPEDPDAWSDETLDRWARQAFELQFEHSRVYRRYCERRGVRPADVSGWREVVPVPTAAFRAVDVLVGDAADAPLTVRTSGTTRGTAGRGWHRIRSPHL